MIHTVTVNPALDLTFRVPAVKIDDKIRAERVYRAAGGNGINVSRVVARLNHATVAMGLAGGRAGDEIAEFLEAEQVLTWFCPIRAQTRTNVIIHDDNNQQIRVSSPGPQVMASEIAALELSIFDLRPPDFLVIAGGLLDGMPEDFYLRIIRRASEQGIRVVADVDQQLRKVVEAGIHLIKPNQYELERLTQMSVRSYADALKASRVALDLGVEVVVCSLGPLGAVLVTETEAWRAIPPKVTVDSAVGSGDSLLAGVLVAITENRAWEEVLRWGVACGAATAMTPGTDLCRKDTIEALLSGVRVERL